VTFTVVGAGQVNPPVVMTNANGVAVASYESAALSADQQADITVAIDRDDEQKSVMLRGLLLTAESSTTTLPANGVSSASIGVSLRMASSLVAVPGRRFSSCRQRQYYRLNHNGLSRAGSGCLHGLDESRPGARHRAFGDLLTDTVTMALYAAVPEVVTISPSASSVRADGISTIVVTAVVLDEAGVALPNTPVSWTSSHGTIQSASTATDASGVAVMTVLSDALAADQLVTSI